MRSTLLLALCLACPLALAEIIIPVPQLTPNEPVPDSPARLVVIRDATAPNACDVELYINQVAVGKMAPGETLSLDVPAGDLSLAVSISQAGYCGGLGPGTPQSVLIRPGQTRQFSITVEPGQAFLAPLSE